MIRNKRDLGGLRMKDGRAIRPGMLVRSASLYGADREDLAGISTVIDLRTPLERAQMPDSTYGVRYLPMPLFDEAAAGISHEKGVEDIGIPDMAYLYRRLVLECADSLRRALLVIMGHDYSSGAVLWHCTEGKDRCGLTTALVLEALGADRKTIMTDYLKTNETSLPRAVAARERLLPVRGEAFAESMYRAYIADERYLAAAWEAMDSAGTSPLSGIPEETLEAFRRTVLEDP